MSAAAVSALAGSALAGGGMMTAAMAQETKTYTYDALGRLIETKSAGSVNNGELRALCYDAAGNRISYEKKTGGTPAACVTPTPSPSTSPTPSPTPTPTPTPVSFAISDDVGFEGETFQFTVTKTGYDGQSHSVSFATADGTANALDYSSASGTLTFAAGETSKIVSVNTKSDTRSESNETFYVNLSGATGGATISDGQGEAIIFDNF